MSQIGETARYVRERLGMSQRAAAEALGVSAVHLSNVERGRTVPSSSLLARFKQVYAIDVYVLAFCWDDEAGDAPVSVREARRSLADAMEQTLTEAAKTG
jgi:transcriptional regulator with XRE-family HTH domain